MPGFSFCICLFFTFFFSVSSFFFFFFLFFSVLLPPINSLSFLFCLNAVIGWQLNIYFRDSFIASTFQCFRITFVMFGQKPLQFNVIGILACSGFSLTFLFNISFLSNFSTVDMCLSRRSDLYPFSIKFCLNSEQ